jgi:hypothetical protein
VGAGAGEEHLRIATVVPCESSPVRATGFQELEAASELHSPRDLDYLRAKRIKQGLSRVDRVYDAFIERFRLEYGISPLAVFTGTVGRPRGQGKTPPVTVVLERVVGGDAGESDDGGVVCASPASTSGFIPALHKPATRTEPALTRTTPWLRRPRGGPESRAAPAQRAGLGCQVIRSRARRPGGLG